MIIQTKRAVNALKQAGFNRSDFRVRTPCKNGEYQKTEISLFVPGYRALAYVLPMLATKELDVIIHVLQPRFENGDPRYYVHVQPGKGRLETFDFINRVHVAYGKAWTIPKIE